MIMLCERCYAPVEDGEAVVRLAHADRAHTDGRITWVHSFVHTTACVAPCPAPTEPPDHGTWNASRGIAARRRS